MTDLKRMGGETLCGGCNRPAAFQISTKRYGDSNDPVTTSVMVLCDDCAGSIRYKLQWRQWDHEADNHYRLHGYGARWYKQWGGIEPEEKPSKKVA